jgi:hypothetical protein
VILICFLLVVGTYQVCTSSQVQVNTGPSTTACIYPKQLILNCQYYILVGSGTAQATYACSQCDLSIAANPDVNAQQVQMYNYLTGDTSSLSTGLNGVAC